MSAFTVPGCIGQAGSYKCSTFAFVWGILWGFCPFVLPREPPILWPSSGRIHNALLPSGKNWLLFPFLPIEKKWYQTSHLRNTVTCAFCQTSLEEEILFVFSLTSKFLLIVMCNLLIPCTRLCSDLKKAQYWKQGEGAGFPICRCWRVFLLHWCEDVELGKGVSGRTQSDKICVYL